MIVLNIILLIGILIISIFFKQYIVKNSEIIYQLKNNLKNLRKILEIDKTKKSQFISQKPEFRLLIEIINPVELAAKESKVAKMIIDIAPNFITKEVYKKFEKEIDSAMKERGIDTNLSIIMM